MVKKSQTLHILMNGFIEPEGKYRLAPLYDIMSAYPLISKKQLQSQKIKMAMALKGKSHHYHWHTMQSSQLFC